MQNYVSVHEHQTKPNPALAAVQGQAAQLLRYEVPTYYVSRELLAAALEPSCQTTWFCGGVDRCLKPMLDGSHFLEQELASTCA